MRDPEMNFDYSDDQKYLKDEARKYLAAHSPPDCVRALVGEPGVGYDRTVWDGIVAQGWLGISIPEEFGGLGLSRIELCAIAEELGRVCAPVPFASTLYFFAEALLLAGSESQQQQWLPKVASGEIIGCLAAAERPGPITFGSVESEVIDGHLTGVKSPVPDGGIADSAIVLARSGGKLGLFLARLDNVAQTSLVTIDPSRGASTLTFAGTPVEPLAEDCETAFATLMNRAAVLVAFEQLGGADRCLEMAREFALGRFAFGRSIASYQAIKHKLADVAVATELARSNAYFGGWAAESSVDDLPVAAAAARLSGIKCFEMAARENLQIHGGIGYTFEANCHFYYRRERMLAVYLGNRGFWADRLLNAQPGSQVQAA